MRAAWSPDQSPFKINSVMKYIGLHGIYSNGANSVDKILHSLESSGSKTKTFDYCVSIFDLYNKNKLCSIVNNIEKSYCEGDIIIAHSAGCVLAYLLAKRLYDRNKHIPKIFFFNAALNKKIILPDNVGQFYNFRDMHDNVLLLARIIPSRIIGDLGRVGYYGKSTNITDIHLRKLLHNDLDNHGDLFVDKNIKTIIDIITK